MDRHPLELSSLLELPPDAVPDFDESSITLSSRSAKINELVRYLKAFDSDDKALVFSQFTSFLDRVAAVLQEEGIPFCRFDGRMNAKKVCVIYIASDTSAKRSSRSSKHPSRMTTGNPTPWSCSSPSSLALSASILLQRAMYSS